MFGGYGSRVRPGRRGTSEYDLRRVWNETRLWLYLLIQSESPFDNQSGVKRHVFRMLVETPPPFATEAFVDAGAAVARLEEIYERNTRFLRDRFEAYVNGGAFTTRVRACYPFVRMTTSTHARLDSRLAYGFVAGPGVHETSVTRPDIFRTYLTEQIELLVKNHGVPVEIGESNEPIPIHFAYRRDINIEAALTIADSSAFTRTLRDVFDTPDLAAMDDAIADGTFELPPEHPNRCPCSVPRGSITRCAGSITTPAPIPSISRIS